ncbi:MAG: SRPBCC family protein [Actinobacteria bacterium]|nr:SRPBCC family protein [Actinomycetota bacterium]
MARNEVSARTRDYRTKLAEPEPGRVLTESDMNSSAITTFTVSPKGTAASIVRITIAWDGAGGIGGFFERIFAPRVLRGILADELNRLDAYAHDHRSA